MVLTAKPRQLPVKRARERTRLTTVADPPRPARSEPDRPARIAHALVAWYATHQRPLPWRNKTNPYATWISEIMLQQTQVAAVVPYFERWLERFPNVAALANAQQDAVFAAWQGLGYYSRARNLQRAAQLVVANHGGKIPAELVQLRELPGIGPYTAGAIASIAFERPVPAVDGNVMRVLSRIEALRGDPRCEPQSRRISEIASGWLTHARPSRVNQALMELGALVCTPKQPRCGQCPIVADCRAHRTNLVDKLPELRPRPKPEQRHVVLVLAESAGRLLVVRQPEAAAHWSSLFVFPYMEYAPPETSLAAAKRLLREFDPKAKFVAPIPWHTLNYPITRFRFHATVYLARPIRLVEQARSPSKLATMVECDALAMPAPHRRLLKRWQAGQ